MFQEVLLNEIRKVLPEDISLNDSVATILDISYDAAHRRTNLKSKFSFEESIALAKYFNISLDSMVGLANEQFVSVGKTVSITNEDHLQGYFESSYTSLKPLLNRSDCEIIYSAKDIPLFYTIKEDVLSRFKMYVWLKLLNKDFATRSFDSYYPKIRTLESATKLASLYQDLQITEIWDLTTINSSLKQIHFYYKAGHLSLEMGIELCHSLKALLDGIFKKILSKNSSFKLYYNELLVMNNNVLVVTPQRQSLYVPYSMLTYFYTSDIKTCKEAYEYFNRQMMNSKLLNTSGEKEQNSFYKKLMSKIDALIELLKADFDLNFE